MAESRTLPPGPFGGQINVRTFHRGITARCFYPLAWFESRARRTTVIVTDGMDPLVSPRKAFSPA